MNDKDFRDQVAARVMAQLAARGERPDRAARLAFAHAQAAVDERTGAAEERRTRARTDADAAARERALRAPTAGVNSPPTTEVHPATTPQPADGLVAQPGVLTGVPPEGRNPAATEVMSGDEHATAEALASAAHLPVADVERPVSTAPEVTPAQ